jgi:hypothetical protein
MRKDVFLSIALLSALALCYGCGGNDADALGIGAACTSADTCGENQQCLTEFKGGYCGSIGCNSSSDCPSSSACVIHTNAKNYCFRTCVEKVDCNANRSVEAESNCVSSVVFASGKKEGKVCVPPS